jgi:hypothetical protein
VLLVEKVCPDLYVPSVGKEVVAAFYILLWQCVHLFSFLHKCLNIYRHASFTCLGIGEAIIFSSENNCMTNTEGDYVFLLGALCLHFIDLYSLGFIAVG